MTNTVNTNQNLTFEDVLQAVGDSDPNQTNSGKLRLLLGRGSGTTIQKHLDKIRADRAMALVPAEDAKTPVMPDSVAAMWGAAYGTAMAIVRTRMDAVVQERDALNVRVGALSQDRKGLEDEVGSLADLMVSVEAQLSTITAKSSADAVAAAAELNATKTVSAENEVRLNAELSAAKNQTRITELQSQNAAQTMQVTIDRLTDQIGELKSLLHAARPAPTEPA